MLPSAEPRFSEDAPISTSRSIPRGQVVFGTECDATDALKVRVRCGERSRLAEQIEDQVDRALFALGAGAPGLGSEADVDASLSDQLFRARRLGFERLMLAFESLTPITHRGVLDTRDAETLAFLVRATDERPLVIALDDRDRTIGVPRTTEPLFSFLFPTPISTPTMSTSLSPSDFPMTPEPPSIEELDAGWEAMEADPPYEPPASIPPEAIPLPPEAVLEQIAKEQPPVVDSGRWRSIAEALGVRGPQTLSAFQKLFTESYVPLANAIDGGLRDPECVHARNEFRDVFARAYTEAHPKFVLTGKRPKMVLDVFDLAAKISRQHNARGTQVLLVDAMRFDVGARVATMLEAELDGTAKVVAKTTLFAALPSTTARQLQTLGRGIDCLRSAPESERELEPIRERTANAVRRIRVGSRSIQKLDLVEASLHRMTSHDDLDEICERLTAAIVAHAESVKPRTLLYITGDHGFGFDGDRVSRGGASPEEVIVPAFALMFGTLH